MMSGLALLNSLVDSFEAEVKAYQPTSVAEATYSQGLATALEWWRGVLEDMGEPTEDR